MEGTSGIARLGTSRRVLLREYLLTSVISHHILAKPGAHVTEDNENEVDDEMEEEEEDDEEEEDGEEEDEDMEDGEGNEEEVIG